MKTSKFLLILFCILFLIILGEIAFLYKGGVKKSQPSNPKLGTSTNIKPTPDMSVYEEWINKKKTVMIKSSGQDISEGKIINFLQNATTKGPIEITLMGKSGKFKFVFSASEISNITVYQVVGKSEQPTHIDRLKINDLVTIVENWDTT